MICRGLKPLFTRRDLWSVAVFRLPHFDDLSVVEQVRPIHIVGQSGLRLNRSYQSVVADPFLFAHGDRLFLFYEVKTDHGHGVIYFKTMTVEGTWSSSSLCLAEPFHLSYPQVFSLDGRIFMIPESAQSGAVKLYESSCFPTDWRFLRNLVDAPLRDPTVLITKDRGIFMLATDSDFRLQLLHSPSLDQAFSVVVSNITCDRKISRCAGSLFMLGDRLLRPVQDCSEVYGKSVSFQQVESVRPDYYSERPSGLSLSFSSRPWASNGNHHVSSAVLGGSVYVAVDGRRKDSLLNSFGLGLLRIYESVLGLQKATS